MSTTDYAKIQIPMKASLKKKAEKIAEDYGYSSLQEVIRVFLTNFSEGKIKTSFVMSDTVEYISEEYEQFLDKRLEETRKAIKEGKAYIIHSADELDKLVDLVEDD